MPRNWQARQIRKQQTRRRDRTALQQHLLERHRTQGIRFDIRSNPGRDLWLVASELLARPDDLNGHARELIQESGFRAETVAGLDNRVVRVHREGASRDEVDELQTALDRAGAATSVSYVAPNKIIDKSTATPEMAPRRRATTLPAVDQSVQVVILDTGVNVAARDDGWLEGLLNRNNEDRLDVFKPKGRLDYAAGHGTFIAGQYRQIDPELDLHIRQVLDTDGLSSEVDVAVAMVRAVNELLQQGSKLLVNLSMGTDTLQHEEPLALRVALEIIGEIQDRVGGEVMLVCAAGNEGEDLQCWPAAFAGDKNPQVGVVAVAALAADGAPAEWSTRGRWVTCSAVGESLRSTYVRGTEDRDIDPDPETFKKNAWAYWTGTSFSAPVVGAHIASTARGGGSLTEALQTVLTTKGTGKTAKHGTILDLEV